jgi:hypothetical protein
MKLYETLEKFSYPFARLTTQQRQTLQKISEGLQPDRLEDERNAGELLQFHSLNPIQAFLLERRLTRLVEQDSDPRLNDPSKWWTEELWGTTVGSLKSFRVTQAARIQTPQGRKEVIDELGLSAPSTTDPEEQVLEVLKSMEGDDAAALALRSSLNISGASILAFGERRVLVVPVKDDLSRRIHTFFSLVVYCAQQELGVDQGLRTVIGENITPGQTDIILKKDPKVFEKTGNFILVSKRPS